ncbi:HpaII family restriction endonuclease [uncultured Porphyromonas sp.]|uniref:HpaII family restriction endonuclease n=1 Tax=uncultured Porphyromonas sp. TaxID=159274 RepID=UPI00262CBC5F|nr:HpaII family restriction endonuclease [uncultured Porphyromonas sp.]
MNQSGNKGEWSEVYAFLKLLAEAELNLGDAVLRKVEGGTLPILAVARPHQDQWRRYQISGDLVECDPVGEEEVFVIQRDELGACAAMLLEKIGAAKATFTVPELEGLLASLKVVQLKASSKSKEDIRVTIHDLRSESTPTLGFSIKSQLGSPSTLLNASGATNFCYTLSVTPSTEFLDSFNQAKSFRDKFALLGKHELGLIFVGLKDRCFENNLRLIDSSLPDILGYLLLYYYQGRARRMQDLLDILRDENPMGYDLERHDFYGYKLKKFLVDVALGMTPKTPWSGIYTAGGGYIIVLVSGDLLCYHFYDRNYFEDYLLNNTQLDTPSTGRHGFGQLDSEGRLQLNLQIRFI